MTFQDGALLGYNYLQKKAFEVAPEALLAIGRTDDWQTLARELNGSRQAMISAGMVVEYGSGAAADEDDWEREWEWGTASALFHLSVQDPEFLSEDESTHRQLARSTDSPSPHLVQTNSRYDKTVTLPPIAGSDLVDTMRRRRTIRAFTDAPVSLADLSEMLFAGLGVTGVTRNDATELVLTMTPSGGARNPYEAYVVARNVSGLASGIYHYCALDHTLGHVGEELPERFGDLVGGQRWADDAPCMIVLCAHFDRTMWKYDDPNAYRVVLIEAGHIAQNVMLAGTRHGYTVCPTAALCHSSMSDLLHLQNRVTQNPVYVLAVGHPDPDAPDNDWQPIDATLPSR